MTRNHRWMAAAVVFVVAAGLTASPAEAQFYGPGYWAGAAFGGATAEGDIARGMGAYAMGAGQYNVQTAQARSINSNTAMQWNQYMYQSRVEAARNYHAQLARTDVRRREGAEAVRVRLRDDPNAVDIARGDALNVLLDELIDPKLVAKAGYQGSKVKVGGESIRDIPFQYASAAISVSVHQLTQDGPPPFLKDPKFEADRLALRAVADELREQGRTPEGHKPETIRKAKDQILATRAKVEATMPKGSEQRQAAERYLKALYGLARMLETPAVNVLLAGVEKRPEASLGDLIGFMAAYNLRFGPATSPRQKEVYSALYPKLLKLRQGVAADTGPATPEPSSTAESAPVAVFDAMTYDNLDGKTPPPPAPK